ncbi:MHC class II transactivator isoform X3 [Ahaetulla prasina]|uniref:MHC class II transactivator isoform X3 n=1 Tax=Ahaetulla prasina TaxID=499056 RepID=UPI002646FF0E|nr:MHC class II transactivator isoform X3 [Ahaetulla prasina]
MFASSVHLQAEHLEFPCIVRRHARRFASQRVTLLGHRPGPFEAETPRGDAVAAPEEGIRRWSQVNPEGEPRLSGNSRENAKNGAVSLRTRNWAGEFLLTPMLGFSYRLRAVTCSKTKGLAAWPLCPGASRMAHHPELAMPAFSQKGQFESFLQDDVSPGGIPPETHCLQSETHPAPVDEMAMAPAVQASEVVSDDQENPEVFYTVERDESGEVVCLCSDMGEAYDKIAALAEYLLKDQKDGPAEEHFESLFWDMGAAEGPGGCAEAKSWGPSSDAPEAKRQRLAHPPALCIVSGDPLAIPLNPSQDGTDSPPDFHVQILVATLGPAGRSPEALGPSANGQLWCIPRHGSNIQMIFTFENAQQPCLPPDAPTSPGLVRAFCKSLKEHFRRECHSGPGQPLEHLYLERDLVQHHLDGRGGRSADLRRCHLGEKWEASMDRSSLFQMTWKNDLGSRVIVVLGKAGTGKSLLLQKICLDWADGHMPQFDFVFLFDCRRLSLLHGTYHDFRSLLSDSLGGSCQGIHEVYASLLQNPERVLLLFDGMEDLKDPEGFSSTSGSLPCREAQGLGAILASLFQRKMLKGCTFLLTGRPKERLPQYFPRVDMVLEVVGLSPEQGLLCLTRSFEGSSHWEQEANLIRASPYLFSHCCNPGLCRFICQAVFEIRGQELPSTLTGLFVTYLLQKVASSAASSRASRYQGITALAEVSWSLGQRCQKALLSEQFPSAEVKEFALKTELMVEQRDVYVFSNFVVQNFLLALHLTFAKEIKGKKLTKYLGLGARFRKCLSSGGLVPRFLSGLLFLKDELSRSLLFGKESELDTEKMIARKQRCLSRFIRKLSIRDFSPDKLLELLHCVHETEDQYLLNHLTLELGPDLSFLGFSLTPPDVSVLHSVLRRSSKKFSLDLRKSCIHLDGLRKLVDLKNITKFRVSLGEAVALWKHLWDVRAREALQTAMEKFLVVPFRAKTMGDVDALLGLVQLQRDMAEGREDSAGSSGHLIPPIAGFLQLEFSLGPSSGLEGFRKLADSLVAFSALQHLDLDSPDENEIGDEGVEPLTRVLPRLASLETLNLSRNKITDLGAELLAGALPSLRLLKTLSLYKNNIGDAGAEHVAEVLPQMCALRVLDLHCNRMSAAGARCLTERLRRCPCIQSLALWNPMIPHGVLDHLQQLDSRIKRF